MPRASKSVEVKRLLWQRALKADRVETRARIGGQHLHFTGSLELQDALLEVMEDFTNERLPPAERRAPRYGRQRGRRQIRGQLSIDEVPA